MTSTEESSHSNTISSLENEEEVDEDENSKVNCEKGDIFREFSNNFLNNPKASFPVKLHKILSNPEYSGIISWLPNGESWRVLQPKVFAEKIIPLYFRHARFPSFMRQVNGWGFRRISEGVDENSYSNEVRTYTNDLVCSRVYIDEIIFHINMLMNVHTAVFERFSTSLPQDAKIEPTN